MALRGGRRGDALIPAWRNKCRDVGGRCREDEDGCREQLHGSYRLLMSGYVVVTRREWWMTTMTFQFQYLVDNVGDSPCAKDAYPVSQMLYII